jgi:hypothetical protein
MFRNVTIIQCQTVPQIMDKVQCRFLIAKSTNVKDVNRKIKYTVFKQDTSFTLRSTKMNTAFYMVQTLVHTILVGNQLDAQLLLGYVYFNPLHVSIYGPSSSV